MSIITTIIDYFTKPKVTNQPVKTAHEHIWEYQYSTGNAIEGKSQVSKCACGKWSIRHFGQSERIILKISK